MKKKTYSPQNTIVACDVHGVLFKRNYTKIVRLLWRNKKHLFIPALHLFYPRVIADLIRLKRANCITEAYIYTLGTKYTALRPLIPLALCIANAQKPIEPMIALVHQLKACGYTLHIYSNIGKQVYADLAQRYPNICMYFDAVITPDHTTGYKKKMSYLFLTAYVKKYSNKRLFLIDDAPKNIHHAASVGIEGVVYAGPATCKQLKKMFLQG